MPTAHAHDTRTYVYHICTLRMLGEYLLVLFPTVRGPFEEAGRM